MDLHHGEVAATPEQARRLTSALDRLQIDNEIHIYPDVGPTFLHKHLKPP